MSLVSKLTFALCCATSMGIIGYVHYKQEYDRKQLHLGVERDIERQERRKAEKLFNQPINFTNKLPTSEEEEQLQAS